MKIVRGFTLIELMIVVVVIGVLAAMAYPSYTEYVQRSRIAEATAAMSDLRIRQERYFQDNRTYVSAGVTCGALPPPSDSFNYACAATATTFLITATGGAGMLGFAYTVDESNLRRTIAFPGVSGTRNCWLTKRGDAC